MIEEMTKCPIMTETGSAGRLRNAFEQAERSLSPIDKETWLRVAAE
jgi:hypothetical protein